MLTRKRVIYMAGPLFTQAERTFNLALAAELQLRFPKVEFVVPQLRADSLLPDLNAVVQDCFAQVDRCDIALVNLDGPDADSGTCVELGYAYAKGKTLVGYRTDFREGEADGVNAMMRYACHQYVQAPAYTQGLQDLANAIAQAILAQARLTPDLAVLLKEVPRKKRVPAAEKAPNWVPVKKAAVKTATAQPVAKASGVKSAAPKKAATKPVGKKARSPVTSESLALDPYLVGITARK